MDVRSVSKKGKRIYRTKGAPREAGLVLGRAMGERLERSVQAYLERWPSRDGVPDPRELRTRAIPWVRGLPRRYREELEGIAEGAGVPLGRIAESYIAEQGVRSGCSALIGTIAGRAWIARNNDLWAPELWGSVVIHEIDGRIPRIGFGMEADTFVATGINREKLWLHYHFLERHGLPGSGKARMDPFVFLTEALETCQSIGDVEKLLSRVDRTGSMMLFAVDGKTDEIALFECACDEHARRTPAGGWIAGTNHYHTFEVPARKRSEPREDERSSEERLERMEELISDLEDRPDVLEPVAELRRILADSGVERRLDDRCTVYANVACPGTREIRLASGEGPAASRGEWRRIEWPWGEE